MNSEQVKDIMKVALDLTEGESLSIEVPSKGHGLSLRTMFYRERLKVLRSGVAVNVSVTAIIQRDDGKWLVILSKEKPLQVTIHKADGSSSIQVIDNRIEPVPEEEVPDDVMEILKRHRERREANGG